MVKIVSAILLLLLILLQYRLWLGKGGIPEVLQLEKEIELVNIEVKGLKERNQKLDAEVVDLKTGLEAIEERARTDLGMIKNDEIYYQVIDDKKRSIKHFKPSK